MTAADTKTITLTVNGVRREVAAAPDEKLLEVLRRLGFKGVKAGCREATCGACTVLLDGRAVYACILYAFQAHGRQVRTIEGVGSFEKPHPLQAALVEEGAVQCGYCIPGMVMSAVAMAEESPAPGDEEIREAMDGNLCRCTGYEKIWSAVRRTFPGGAGAQGGGGR